MVTRALGGYRVAVKVVFAAWLITCLSACSSEIGSGEWYTDWDIAGGCTSPQGGDVRTSGAETRVDVCAAVGRDTWIWVTYGAPWCSASKSQAQQIRAFVDRAPPSVLAYAVLTSGDQPFSPATTAHAREWARFYGLPASNVLTEQSSRTVPQHLLIGPSGRTYYRYVGFLRSSEIEELLDEFRQRIRAPDVRSLPLP